VKYNYDYCASRRASTDSRVSKQNPVFAHDPQNVSCPIEFLRKAKAGVSVCWLRLCEVIGFSSVFAV
jgi:hypothetical protein